MSKKLSSKPRLLLLTTNGQDYLQDDLLYGFRHLLNEKAVDHPKKAIMYSDYEGHVHTRPEYSMNARYLAHDPVDRTKSTEWENFDLVINLSCRRNRDLANVYIDGEDDAIIDTPYPGGHVFKRELHTTNVVDRWDKSLHPITFGLPDHLAPLFPAVRLFDSKSVEVHSSFTVAHGPNRRELAAAFPVEKCVTRAGYIEAINEARYVLSPKGAGWDCQRHYEILGRAVPIIEVGPDAPVHFQKMWRDGENCLTFDGKPGTIVDKIAATDSKQWDQMVQCGYEELFDKYLATSVALRVLEMVGAV